MPHMAEQETQERDDATTANAEDGSAEKGTDDSGQASDESTEQESAENPSNGKSEEKSEPDSKAEEKSDEKSEATSDEKSEATSDGKSEATSDEKSEAKTEQTPARRSESHAKPEELTEEDRAAQERNRSSFLKGSRSEDDDNPRRSSSIDVSELVWKLANLLATVVRAVTLVFAAILVVQIGLSVAAVNPDNGLARFVRGFSDTVVLGFRDLFLPSDPTIMVVVNYGIAAVFWVLVGVFLSSALRWIAARIS